ncbi:hypothetical protein ElyMa_004769200 [Elysia marginata]|uniref:Uncharacterized protein n=1 Tax=Elysia marginata TaxID=1093978 RepID=A0AAV4IHF4_9GAST|nr:hypothetical protein ElyMa_004769200 [Elysia marginata]
MLGRGVENSNCHATVSRVSSFQVDFGQAVFDLHVMGYLADCRHAPDMVQTKCVLSQPESSPGRRTSAARCVLNHDWKEKERPPTHLRYFSLSLSRPIWGFSLSFNLTTRC